MAVALGGDYRERRIKSAELVYWPSPTARPVSNHPVKIQRVNRKRAAELKARRDEAVGVLWAAMQMLDIARYPNKGVCGGWEYLVRGICHGEQSAEKTLEYCMGHTTRDVAFRQIDTTLRGADKLIAGWSLDHTNVEYLRF
jgi:hypothetical protein